MQHTFDQLAATKAQRVMLRVDGYERVILDLRGLFLASSSVTEEEFMRYLDGTNVLGRYPALHRIGYAPLVTPVNRAQLQARFAAHGIPLDESEMKSELYAPVLYGYPSTGSVLGMNLSADPGRFAAMAAARDENSPQVLASFPLRFDAILQPGYLLYVPIYTKNPVPGSVADRQRSLSGFLYAAFRGDELIYSTIQDDLGTMFDLSLYAGSEIKPDRLVFSSSAFGAGGVEGAKNSLLSVQRQMADGEQWTFVFHSKPDFIIANQSFLPVSILIGGLTIALLGFWLAWIIRDRLAAEGRLRYLAYHDELSGLPNRISLYNEINRAIEMPGEDVPVAAVFIVELTHFKQINYTFGHSIGDELIKQASIRLRSAISHCTVARVSNLQFGVLAKGRDRRQALALAERMLKSFDQPLVVREISYELGSHIGTALFPDHGTDAERLLRHADVALNQARMLGLGVVMYDQLHDPFQPRRLSLLGDFRQALKDGQIELFCQPKASLSSGTIGSVEALVRWRHPDFGLVQPGDFIPLVEPTSLVHPLTQHVLRAAVEQSRHWRDQRFNIKIAVNLSTRNLLNPHLPQAIGELIKTCDGDVSWIELEITESSLMRDPAAALVILQQIHDMGLKLSVDDFGTGYSGLDYLMKFPIDTIKIDRSFTSQMTENSDAAAIVKSTIGMAHEMGLRVVAEGIENQEVWDALKALNCDEAQGYYVGAPMPMAEFPLWLRQSSWRYAGAAAH